MFVGLSPEKKTKKQQQRYDTHILDIQLHTLYAFIYNAQFILHFLKSRVMLRILANPELFVYVKSYMWFFKQDV